jgi:hypothetical protein
MSNTLDNWSPAMIADELGEVKAELRGLTKRKGALETELARRGVVRCLGERWQVVRSKFDRSDPDRDKLRAELGERYSTEFCKPTAITRWNCTAVEAARKAA